jgi:hypothetical protein
MEAEPFSLYLDLFEGEKADLEVVAKASLALLSALKEAAFIIDPSLEVRLELQSGTEGSLRLNTVIKSLKAVLPDRATLKALTIIGVGWFSGEILHYTADVFLDKIFKSDASITDVQAAKIKEIVKKALEEEIAATKVGEVYRELSKDTAIRGVGATLRSDERPEHIVPKEQFQNRLGTQVVINEILESRSVITTQSITLISPVLLQSKRGWRFRANGLEFAAQISDSVFMEAALTGRLAIPLVEGILMNVQMRTDETRKDGVWVVKKRVVQKINSIVPPPTPSELSLFTPRERQ